MIKKLNLLVQKLNVFSNKANQMRDELLREGGSGFEGEGKDKEITLGTKNLEVLLQADQRMCTEIDVKVYESPSKMLKDKIGKFMEEMQVE